ncbi:MAG: hypothetical protein QM655_12415 [Nocardioidaceae bacterium]
MSSSTAPTGLRARRHRVVARHAVSVLALATALGVLAGCGGGDDDKKPAAEGSEAATWQIKITDVAGRLPNAARTKLADQAETTLQAYVADALVASPPAADAFAAFTKGGAKQAEGDRALLTSEGFTGADQIVPTKLTADLSVLAPHAKPAGATARVDIGLDVDGKPVTVAGKLLLTPTAAGWKIFGYDLQREGVN